jgi:uncharacterized membrane protein
MISRNSTDLVAVVALTVLAVAAVLLQVNNIIAIPLLALPLVFVLPGYALTAVLFPKGGLGLPETLAFSLGLSLATDIVGGLVINLTPQGLAVLPWMLFLVSVTLGASAIAARRRPQRLELVASQSGIGLNVGQIFLFGLSIVLVVSAVMIVRIQLAQPSTQFTELWTLPNSALGQNAVDVGIRNSEVGKTEYKLEIQVGGNRVYESSPIALLPGETWEQVIPLPIPAAGDMQVLLYRADNPGKVYRQVMLRSSAK